MGEPMLPLMDEITNRCLEEIWSWNSTVPEAIGKCVHDLFAEQAMARPDAPSVCAWDGELTYGKLDMLSSKLAGHLVQLGVQTEDVVPLCFEKSMWTVVAMLAVLKAGGAFVPLDPEHPASRHEEIFRQTGAQVVLASAQYATLWASSGHSIVTVNEASTSQLPRSMDAPNSSVKPENAAYIIFTSGSTGIPKGVVLEHKAVATSCLGHGQAFGITDLSRVLQFASYTFDACIAEIITTLVYGGCVCVPSDSGRRNDLANTIRTMDVNWALLTPSVARLLDPSLVPSLKILVVGGEQVSSTDWDRWQSSVRTINGYGPTECCVSCIGYSSSEGFRSGIIGTSIASVSWVVDPENDQKLAPLGSIGELLVEGPILARGYLNDTEKTAVAFINDPAWLLEGCRGHAGRQGRLYKTGDLVQYDSNGNLVCLGRKDSQVKLRGQRVELGEIEHHLRQCMPTANNVVAEIITPDSCHEKAILVAFVCVNKAHLTELHVATQDEKETARFTALVESAEANLGKTLPNHMIPSLYIPVSQIPMTTSGKIDRKQLRGLGSSFSTRQLASMRGECNSTKRQPRTEVEYKLQRVWAQVLNMSSNEIGIDDSLFRLGGDSISAMQVVSLCRTEGISLTTKDVIKGKDIRGLAKLDKSTRSSAVGIESLGMEQAGLPFELSPIQQMYIQAFPGRYELFDQCFYLRLKKPVSSSAMARALETVVNQHAMLRARIRQQGDGTWRQIITDDVQRSLQWRHHRLVNDNAIGGIIANSRRSLDFGEGPVLAADLFSINEAQTFFITVHHLFVDLVSWRIILQDIEQLVLTGSMSSLPTIPFQSWCQLQRAYAHRHLTPKFVLPFGIKPPMISYWEIDDHWGTWSDTMKHEFTLDARTTASILGDCNEGLRTEPVELFIAGLIQSFSHVFQDRDIPTVFSEGHGREPWDDNIDLSRTVGWFTTLFPTNCATTTTRNIKDTIRRTKDGRRSLPHKGWGYFSSRFHNPEGIEVFKQQSPLEVLVNYQGLYQQLERQDTLFQRSDAPGDQDLDVSLQGGRFAVFVVSIVVQEGKTMVSFMYNRKAKHQDRITRWIQNYETTMQEIVAVMQNDDRTYTLSDFPMAFHGYSDLDRFVGETLPSLGISNIEDVENIYQCSPMQQAILFNRMKHPKNYWIRSSFKVVQAPKGAEINVPQIKRAWEAVVERHTVLRTVFVLDSPGMAGPAQIVLRNRKVGTKHVKVKHRTTTANLFKEHVDVADEQRYGLEHHLTIYELLDGMVFCVLEVSHAIIDGHSMTILCRDLSVAYSDCLQFEALPPYSDYITFLRQEDSNKPLEYWKTYLNGADPCFFPSQSLSLEKLNGQDDVIKRAIPFHGTAKLRAFSNSYGLTAFTVIQLAWALVLGTFSNTASPCFGYLISRRHLPINQIDDIAGPMINMITCRANLRSCSGVLETLQELQMDTAESNDHQSCSLADVQHALKLGERSMFNTAITYQRYDSKSLLNDRNAAFQRCHEHDPSEYDITIHVDEDERSFELTFVYRNPQISQFQAESVVDTIGHMINAIVANPEGKLGDITAVSRSSLEQLFQWNSTVPETTERCIHDLFAEQARARPDAPAVCAWDGDLTYGELDTLSSKLAGHLVQLGVKPEDMVPLCFEKSMWTVVAMLAVLKAGGAFVPLDPEHPASRHEEIFKQSGAQVVLASVKHSARWAGTSHHVVTVRAASLERLPTLVNTDSLLANPTNAAYVMFTSGSTGIPKGVVLEHKAVATSCLGHGQAFGITDLSRVLQFASYTFDACIAEIITTLVYGGCVCVPSDSDRRNDLANTIRTMGVNWAFLTPSVARLLDPSLVPSLKILVVGGEQVSSTDWDMWQSSVRTINGYGPTECCVFCIGYSSSEGFRSGIIGTSIASVSWVVDPENYHRLVPLGSVGELLVEGPILARGYLNDDEKTAAAFINDPAWLLEGCRGHAGRQGRLYKTGDLVQYDSNGNLVYLGRKDSQVKVRGQRVELSEIEHHIRELLPEAKQLAVEVVKPSGEDRAMLAAFVQLEDDTRIALPGKEGASNDSMAHMVSLAEVEKELVGRLPAHMVPTAFFAVRTFPTTTSGKTDRKRLREIGASFTAQQLAEMRTFSQGPKRQPSTEAEQTMQQLWARVLSIESDSIGLDDSFFHLGGDSISAMKLVGEARKAALELSVADVFLHSRLVDLASTAICDNYSSSAAIVPVDNDGPVEQSYAQGRLWFLEELYPGLNWYLMPFAVRIKGPLQLAALNAALLAIESRHETLRTTFATEGSESVQIVQPFCAKQLNVIALPLGDEHSHLDAVQRDQTTPFDLSTEPGWRVTIYRIGNNDHILSIVMHHIVSDGWSVDVLMRELTTFYSASLRGQDLLSQVQPLPIQYRDFSLWQRQQVQVDEHQKQLSYWLAQLQTSRPAELLCDKPRPASLSGKAGERTVEICGSLYTQLQQFCKVHGVTLFVALLAAFRATHFRLTGQDDATIGTVNANRDRWELKNMIGFFVNMQCLRITVEDESFEELVQQVQSVVVASLANQNVPFENIVSKLKNDRDLSRHPLVQLVFVVHSQRDLGELILEGVETEGLHGPATSRFDLEFHFFQKLNGLQGNVVFSTDLYSPETIDNMLSLFSSVLEGCLREPTAAVASLPLLTDASYAQLDGMGLIRIEETAYPRESSIVDLFCQQVSACPFRVAVKDSTQDMTYAQLDKASDVIARWLQRRSLAPETLVGVFANRCCQTIVAFLGITKAGLAYLPFDTMIPGKRMEAVLCSLPGRKIVLLGNDVHPSNMELSNVEFVHIKEALEEGTDDGFGSQETATTFLGPSATSLAYVMYTSGSTGKPKGVMVEHRGIVRLVRDNNIVQHLPVSRVMAHVTNLAFDASTWEIYVSLLNGGTLICIDTIIALDPIAMLQTVSDCDITMALLTPALFRQYISESPALIAAFGMLCVGGEALHQRDFFAAERIMKGKLINCYGPTENTGISTSFVLNKDEKYANGVPIGRALSNSGAYVMDSHLQLVPLGVMGELVVTGDGVARGYTNPQRDIGQFFSVEIAGERVKAYRTGDYVRNRPTDGQLEFFGRMDGQIKIRGQRIELGEIEHVLRSHKSVIDAVTVLQHHDGNEAQLAGFVTIHEDAIISEQPGDDGGDEAQHVNTWEKQFDAEVYLPVENVRSERIGRDFIGWTSMYDGSEIDKTEMNEWLDDTIATTLNGRRPGHVLEIGSGTGMVLFNLGDGLQSYIGLDPSRNAVNFVEKTVRSMPALAGRVRMHKATAADVGQLERPIAANLVVVNSVVQYFPSQKYLFKVVQDLVGLGGVQTLFFGDIRSYALYQEFLATRALHICGDKTKKAELRRMMTDMERVERELLVDPAFFTALPSRLPGLVEHVEILPKMMKANNELSCYRYAAVVHVRTKGRQEQGREIRQIEDEEWIDFTKRGLDRQSLQKQLKALSSSHSIAISNIPHSKTIVSRCLIESLEDVAADALGHQDWLSSVYQKAQRCPSLSPTDLVEVAQEAGCRVEISSSRQHSQHGGLDAIFHQCTPENGENRVLFRFLTDHAERPLHCLTNEPLRQQVLQKTKQELRNMLEGQLPPYMVPREITVLDTMPINQNGKVDRRILARWRQEQTASQGPVQQPTSAAEQVMQQLWARVLGIEPDSIGLDNSFFHLGGDSIAAMKLVGEAGRMGLQLSVADIFRHPKLAALASQDTQQCSSTTEEILTFSLLSEDVDAAQVRDEAAAMCSLEASLIEDVYPCSPLQEGLMSLTAKRAGDYVMQSVLELRADVDEEAFRAAWQHVVQLTGALRTRIVQHSELGLLQVVVAEDIQWTEAEGLEEYLQEDKSTLMGLGDPLARYALVKVPCGGKRWFAWTIHHALYDGWSLPRILRAVKQVYTGGVLERQPSFNIFIQYLGQQDQEAATAYWQTALADCEATLFPPLPLTVTQPVSDTVVEYQCPPLTQSARDTTTSTLVRAAWAIVASRYTSSDDVVFGATVTGRNAPVAGINTMIGPTIATVPVRVSVQSDQTVSAFLEALQQQATDMIAYEQTGLQRIAKIGPGARHACGFQTLLVVQPAVDMLRSDDALGEWHSHSELQDFTTYALTVQCTLAAEGVQVTASFDARVVEHWVVEKMLRQFSFAMQQLAEADPDRKMVDIDATTPEDVQQLWTWNQDVSPAVDRCVHDLFAEQAMARPDAPAVCAWDGELTYGELDTLSSKLAGHLVQLGVKPEDMVPLCFEKSMWTVVAMLAVLKAGGAFVPLDPEHPASRHEEIFRQTGAQVVLASAQYATLWASSGHSIVTVNEASTSQLPRSMDAPNSSVKPENAAYIIFTSGSTGIPKGVVLEHKAVATSCLGHGQAFGITDLSRVLQFASYTFDACIAEIITTLVYGGCVCVPSDSGRRNDLANTIRTMDVNWALLTPSVARLLDPSLVPSLKILVVGGEQVSSTDWDRWQSSVRTINGYGPTECCVSCIGYSSSEGFRSGIIGTSIASVSWVVDPENDQKLAPLGSIGELLVEGPILARGYLNDTEKTAVAFINDPAWLLEGCRGHAGRQGRLYKTGDLVQYDSNGNLVCLGRKDSQVKLRGQRVELGEIEHHLRQCMPTANNVVAEIITPDSCHEKAILVAFVCVNKAHLTELHVATQDEKETARFTALVESAEANLGKTLPNHMIPSLYIPVSQIPMTTSGKIDRKQLRGLGSSFSTRQLASMRGECNSTKRQPRTEVEYKLQRVWAQVLNMSSNEIGLDDSLFRLGGDSIAAMELVGEARKIGLQLSVADIFRHPRLVDLASLDTQQCSSTTEEILTFSLLSEDVDAAQVRDEAAAMCSLEASLIEDVYPCSPLQEGLMSLTAKRAGDYVMQSVLELRADVDEEAFRAAWQHVVQLTGALRTRIVQHSELGLLQVVVAEDVQWTEAEYLEKYLQEDKAISMGLGDPLTRYALVKEPCGGKRWFAWTIHHALYDGWSLPRILHAVKQVYRGAALERQLSFNAFIRYLGQQNQKDVTAYWQTALADCEAALFPPLTSTVTQPIADTTRTCQCPPLIPSDTETTASTLIRAAWAIVASRYTSSDDVVFGATVTGRNAPVAGINTMIGPTIATVPVRVSVQSDQTVSAFLEALQQQATDMIAYEQTGLQRIAKIGPGARHACGFQTLLVVQPAVDMLRSDDALGEWHSHSELQDFTTYALTVQCTLAAEGVQVTASFDARVVEHWVVEKMLRQFSFAMQQLAEADPDRKMVDIDATTPEDVQQLWTWNQDVSPAVDRCVHDLFAEQAMARPDAPAVCAWDGELTYGELDTLSSKLAGHLVQLGVKPEDMVPLCFEKSMWTVVAMLAVLKAGGAFVPLDPEHPASRHEEIFRQTGAQVVLASAQYATLWASSGHSIVTVNEASTSQLPRSMDAPNSSVKPENAAYIIFTSGSTGIPKGVVLEHKAVATSCLGHGQAFGITDLSRVLQFASYTFDACIAEIITTLVYGGCVCVPSDSGRRNDLANTIRTMDVNWALLTPSVARLLDPSLVPSLKILVVGGEQVSSTDWDRWQSSVRTINGYGPTECCVSCIGYSSSEGFRSGIIGTSIASVSWVVDPENDQKLAPLGSIGELLVEGPILARGYLNDTEKTAVAFINDPAWLLEGCRGHAGRQGRLYKTGDLVQYDSNGNLVYLGRKDSQVKVRGQRVELSEIEHHIRELLPEAKQLAVEVVKPSGEDRAMLAAFVQLEDDTRIALPGKEGASNDSMAHMVSLAEVEKELVGRLPAHMVPTAFFAVRTFPTTTSGKTDRKRLREIGASFTAQQLAEMRTFSQGPKRQPSTEAEQTMQQLWARVLGIEPDSIGLDDSFFRLGGDSIGALKLVDEARKAGLQLRVADIFRHPKLAAVASVQISQHGSALETVPAFSFLSPTMKNAIFSVAKPFCCSLPMDNVMDIVPASYIQEFFIVNGVRAPQEAFNYLYIDLGATVDVQVLKASCCALLHRFPILRTHFVYFERKLFQVVPRDQDLPFSIFNVDGPLAEESQAVFMRDIDQISPLGLPTSFMLVQDGSKMKRLILRLSHAQYDGVCIPIMLKSLASIYQQESLLPSPGFNNYLSYIQNRLSTSIQYWHSLLAGSHITNITSILRRTACKDTALRPVKVKRVICTPQLPAGLTMASLVSSAWAIALSHISGEEDVVYGLVVAGRNSDLPGITDIMGPCVNFVPVRAQPCSTRTSVELLQSVQDQYVSLGESDSMGFDDIVQHCTNWPAKSEFDSIVQHQNIEEQPEIQFAGETIKLQWFENPFVVPRQLAVLSQLRDNNLAITISGNTGILSEQCAEKLLTMLCDTIIQLSGNPKTRLAACKSLLPTCTWDDG